MNQSIKNILLLMLLFTTLIAHGQSKLYIHKKDGSNQSYALSDIRKITVWSSNFIEIIHKNRNYYYVQYNDITYMSFKPSSNSILESKKDNISIYPNPVINNLTIKNEEAIDELKIFDVQGKMQLHLSPKSEIIDIDMSLFPAGVYFLQIVSHNKVNTSKIIKSSNN